MQDIRLQSDALSADLSPLGAELRALRDGAGRDLLWDGDPAWWAGRAPILFPIVGTLPEDRYMLGGESFSLPRHGFARRRAFAVAAQDDASVTFRLEDDAGTRAVWPFAFRLDLRHALAGATLLMAAEVTNRGDAPMPFSLGFHPAFRWPLPYGAPRSEHRLRFEQPEPAPIRRVNAQGLLTPAAHPTPVKGRDLPLDDALFADDAVILDRLASGGLAYGVPGTPGLRVRWRGLPELGLWMKPGADFLCIEPWAGHSAPEGFAGDLAEKPGIMILPPGEARRFVVEVSLSPDPFAE